MKLLFAPHLLEFIPVTPQIPEMPLILFLNTLEI